MGEHEGDQGSVHEGKRLIEWRLWRSKNTVTLYMFSLQLICRIVDSLANKLSFANKLSDYTLYTDYTLHSQRICKTQSLKYFAVKVSR